MLPMRVFNKKNGLTIELYDVKRIPKIKYGEKTVFSLK
jgi:hypothetical protein